MSSTRPAKCLVCEQLHTDWDKFHECEAGEFFELLVELGTLDYRSMAIIRQEKGKHDDL